MKEMKDCLLQGLESLKNMSKSGNRKIEAVIYMLTVKKVERLKKTSRTMNFKFQV